jgi:hypothetical protein
MLDTDKSNAPHPKSFPSFDPHFADYLLAGAIFGIWLLLVIVVRLNQPLLAIGFMVVGAGCLLLAVVYLRATTIWLFTIWVFLLPFSVRAPLDAVPITLSYVFLYLIWVKQLVTYPRIRIVRSRIVWLIVAFLILSVLATVIGLDPANSVRKLFNVINFVIVFFLTIQLVREQIHVKAIASALFYAGALLALMGIAQVTFAYLLGGGISGASRVAQINQMITTLTEGSAVVDRVADWSRWWRYNNWYATAFGSIRATGTAWTPMAFAQMLYFSFFPALTLALSWPKQRGRIWFLWLVLIEAAAMVATFSRGAWIGTIVGCMVIGFFYLQRRVRVTRSAAKRFILMGFLAALLVVLLAPGQLQMAGLAAFQSAFSPEVNVSQFDTSNQARFGTYRTGLTLIATHPLLGVGPGNYANAASSGEGATSHNLYIDIAVEMGMVAAIVYIGILIISLFNHVYVARRSQEWYVKALSVGWTASIVALVFYWGFTSYFFEPKLNMMLWLLLGVGVALRGIVRGEARQQERRGL